MYRENPEETDDRQYYDYHLDRNGSPLELKQQTPVEWYTEQLNVYEDMAFNKEITLGQYHIKKQELLEQAKEMDKKQKVDAWDLSRRDIDYPANGEQYYNKTFGKL